MKWSISVSWASHLSPPTSSNCYTHSRTKRTMMCTHVLHKMDAHIHAQTASAENEAERTGLMKWVETIWMDRCCAAWISIWFCVRFGCLCAAVTDNTLNTVLCVSNSLKIIFFHIFTSTCWKWIRQLLFNRGCFVTFVYFSWGMCNVHNLSNVLCELNACTCDFPTYQMFSQG